MLLLVMLLTDPWYQCGFVMPLTSGFCLQYSPGIRRRSTVCRSSSEIVQSVATRHLLLGAVCFYPFQEILANGFDFPQFELRANQVGEGHPPVQRARKPLDGR